LGGAIGPVDEPELQPLRPSRSALRLRNAPEAVNGRRGLIGGSPCDCRIALRRILTQLARNRLGRDSLFMGTCSPNPWARSWAPMRTPATKGALSYCGITVLATFDVA